MWLQCEDCMDCVKLSLPAHEIQTLFDQSSGNDKNKPDVLSISGMSELFGGAQNRIRRTEMIYNAHLIPFNNGNALNARDVQHMIFNYYDNGPF